MSDVNFIISAVDDFSSTFDTLNGKMKNVEDIASNLGKKMLGGGLASAAGIGAATTAAGNFDHAMRQVNTMVQASDTEFRRMKEQVRDIGKEFPVTSKQAAEGLYQIVSAGVPATEQMTFLEASLKAATAGSADLNDVIYGSTGVIKAYGKEFSEVDRINDLFFKTVENGQTTMAELSTNMGKVADGSFFRVSMKKLSHNICP